MHRYIIRRLFLTIFVTVGAAILIFSIMYFIPGDPAETFGIDSWKCYILPVVCASLNSIISMARQTRHSVLEVMNSDYITTARAKGLREGIVIYKHMLPNALIPIITTLGGQLSFLIGGSIITEKIFSFPGIGFYMTEAVTSRDYPIVRAGVILIAAFSALMMLLVDIVYGYVDPRIKAQYVNMSKKKGHIDRSRQRAASTAFGEASWTGNDREEEASRDAAEKSPDAAEKTRTAAADYAPDAEESDSVAGRRRKEGMLKQTFKRLLKDKVAMLGLAGILFLVVISLLAPFLTKYGPDEMDLDNLSSGPSVEHILGTDLLGRDYLTRLLYGGRYSLLLGFSGALISLVLSISIGSVAGYFGGWADDGIMRLCDIVQSIPGGLICVVLSITLGTSFWVTIVALAASSVCPGIRMTRAQILSVRKLEYLDAAKTVNCGTAEIMFRHILPNICSPMILGFANDIGAMINQASGLSVIGLGVQPPTPEWGQMLSAGRNYMRSSPHLVLFPGIFMFVVSFCINLFGDGLRDALDPKLKK